VSILLLRNFTWDKEEFLIGLPSISLTIKEFRVVRSSILETESMEIGTLILLLRMLFLGFLPSLNTIDTLNPSFSVSGSITSSFWELMISLILLGDIPSLRKAFGVKSSISYVS
jgi:hypothetical protein